MAEIVTSPNPRSKNDELVEGVSQAAELFRSGGKVGDLVRLRNSRISAGTLVKTGLNTAWQPDTSVPERLFDLGETGMPEIHVNDLSPETVSSAMYYYGALIVRNFFQPARALHFQKNIDRVMDSALAYVDATADDGPDDRSTDQKSYFMPVPKTAGLKKQRAHVFLKDSGSVETFLSPRVSQELLDCFEELGLRTILQRYFRDEPCVSYQKCVLRRATPLPHRAEWHQDGAFMDEGIQSLNVWVALTDCGDGTDAPGMDLVPKRLNKIIPTGTNGAIFNWSVSDETVREEFKDVPVARPYFGAGDAVFFDHFNLHATSSDPAFTQPRYAIETWFFSKSRCAKNQTPVYW